eukprot:gene14707-16235_t
MHRGKNEKLGFESMDDLSEIFGNVSVGRNDGLKALESSNAGRKSNEKVEKGFFSQRKNADDNGGIMEEMPSGSPASSSGSRTDPLYEDWSESESEFSPESEPGYEAESKSEPHEKFDYLSNENRLKENNEEKRTNEKSSVHGNEANQSVGLEVEAQNQPTQVEDKLEDYSSDDDNNDSFSDVDDSKSDDIDVPETIAPLDSNTNSDNVLGIIRDIRRRTSSNVAPNINVIREIEESQIRHNATFEQVDNEMKSQIMDCEDETNMSTISKEEMGHGSVAGGSWMHVQNNTQGCHHFEFNPNEIEMKSERIDEEEPMDIDLDEEMITAFDSQMQIGNRLHFVHFRLPTPEPMDVDEAIEPSSNVFQMDSNPNQLGAAVESKLLTSASLPQQCSVKSVQEGHPGQWFFEVGNTSQDATTSGTSSNLAQLNKGGHSLSLKKNTLKRKHDEEHDGTSEGAQQRRPGKVLKARRSSQESITTLAVVAELEDGENSLSLQRNINKGKNNEEDDGTSKEAQQMRPGKVPKPGKSSQESKTTPAGVAELKDGDNSLSLQRNINKRKSNEADDGTSKEAQQMRPRKVPKPRKSSQESTITPAGVAELQDGDYSLSLQRNINKRKSNEADDGTSKEAQEMRPGKVLKARRSSQESKTTPAGVAELKDGENSSCLKRNINKRKGHKKNNKTNISEPEEESPAKLAENAEMKQQVAVDGESANEKIIGRPWKLKRNAYKKNHVEQNNNNTCQQESGKKRKWM